MKKSLVLKNAVLERRAVVVPGCHDAFSAKVIEAAGFEAIQVSGFGVAASQGAAAIVAGAVEA
ncbi:MAG: isocitrate lyase/phosphoenolpyruvate mutase family protein [Thermoanaerobaculia bacterium]